MTSDRKNLKIQALLEKVTSLTTQYENQAADLRVELTIVSEELEEAREKLRLREEEDSAQKASADPAPDFD